MARKLGLQTHSLALLVCWGVPLRHLKQEEVKGPDMDLGIARSDDGTQSVAVCQVSSSLSQGPWL